MADGILSGLAGIFGNKKTTNSGGWDATGKFNNKGEATYAYNSALAKGPREQWQSLTNTYGGAGNYGMVSDGDGGYVSVNKAAYDAVPVEYDKMTMRDYQAANPSSSGWFGKDGYLGMGAQVLSAGSSVMNAITGMKALGLAKDQFEHEKGLAAANLYNSGTLANNALQNRTEVGNALAGNSITDAEKQSAMDKTRGQFVKTAIG